MIKHCLVIGDPINHSRSPELHNAWYRDCGLDKQFCFSSKRVLASELGSFLQSVKNSDIRGISVTIPHKQTVIQFLDQIEETANKIGAVNTIVHENGKLIGYNTDWIGVIRPLEKRVVLNGRSVCIVGTGGAARAAAWGLATKGADISIWGRDRDRAKNLAADINCTYLSNLSYIRDLEIIIHATSVGMSDSDRSLLHEDHITSKQIIFDLVYTPAETELLKLASKKGATVISGTEMFTEQAKEQFKLFTNRYP